MKTIATFSLIGVLLAAGSPVAAQQAAPQGQSAPAFKAKKLTRAEFDALRANPSKLLVLDVRRPDELQSIGGFGAYLSIQASELERSLAWIPRDRTIVTVSN